MHRLQSTSIGRRKLSLPILTGVGILLVVLSVAGIKYTVDLRRLSSLNEHTLTLESKIEPVSGSSDIGLARGGDAVVFSFQLTNMGRAQAKQLTLNTQITKDKLYFIRNIKGAGGLDVREGKLVFRNLVILPHQSQAVSFEANLVYGTKGHALNVRPRVENASGEKIVEGIGDSIRVAANKVDQVPSMSKTKEGVER